MHADYQTNRANSLLANKQPRLPVNHSALTALVQVILKRRYTLRGALTPLPNRTPNHWEQSLGQNAV
jgi:hypothetical protein